MTTSTDRVAPCDPGRGAWPAGENIPRLRPDWGRSCQPSGQDQCSVFFIMFVIQEFRELAQSNGDLTMEGMFE